MPLSKGDVLKSDTTIFQVVGDVSPSTNSEDSLFYDVRLKQIGATTEAVSPPPLNESGATPVPTPAPKSEGAAPSEKEGASPPPSSPISRDGVPSVVFTHREITESAPHPEPMTWSHALEGDRSEAFVTDDRGHIMGIGGTLTKHVINSDGSIQGSIGCPHKGCGFHVMARLDGWR